MKLPSDIGDPYYIYSLTYLFSKQLYTLRNKKKKKYK